MAFSEPCISIPVQDSDELVLISATELPVEPEDLLDLLRGEYAPLHLWLDFAKAHLANGKVNWSTVTCPLACLVLPFSTDLIDAYLPIPITALHTTHLAPNELSYVTDNSLFCLFHQAFPPTACCQDTTTS